MQAEYLRQQRHVTDERIAVGALIRTILSEADGLVFKNGRTELVPCHPRKIRPIRVIRVLNNMKSIFLTLLACLFLTPTYAQFQVGVTAGLNISKFTVSDDQFKDYVNKVNPGLIVGPTVIYNLPKTHFGFDVSALYDLRSAKSKTYDDFKSVRCHSFQFPVNLRYNFIFEDMDTAYGFLFTGPQFGWTTGNNDQLIASGKGKTTGHALERRWVNQSSTFSWNFGVGAVVFNKLQVKISYNLALRKTSDIQQVDLTAGTSKVLTSGKAHACQVSLSYLF